MRTRLYAVVGSGERVHPSEGVAAGLLVHLEPPQGNRAGGGEDKVDSACAPAQNLKTVKEESQWDLRSCSWTPAHGHGESELGGQWTRGCAAGTGPRLGPQSRLASAVPLLCSSPAVSPVASPNSELDESSGKHSPSFAKLTPTQASLL